MCGIGMVLGTADAPRLAARLADAIAHRGPDDAGIVELRESKGAPLGALVHRRLAILDLSPAGHQPMASADGRWTMVFNGEIYNFAALREELRRGGAAFRSGSDSEVILEGVARHGLAYLRRLRGMYAIILWDAAERCVHLARDPFGIKPLYLAEAGGTLVAASELRALLATGVVEPRISRSALREYLAWGSVPEPATIIAGIEMLPAGVHVRVEATSAGVRRSAPAEIDAAWTRPPERPITDRGDALRAVCEALTDSVAHHLVSDVPVAVFLSGGVDSSAIAALATRAAATPIDSFTIVFGERAFDEAPFARRVAERFGTRHHEIRLTGEDLLAALPHALAAMDQPSIDGLNTYAVSKAVRDHGLKVVLSGLGGDELFAGYPAFRRAARGGALRSAPLSLRRAGARLAGRLGGRAGKVALLLEADDAASGAYRASRALFAGRPLDALAPPAAGTRPPAAHPAGLTPLQAVSWYELTGYMRNTLLRDSDVFSMSQALELRVPFVDPEVARVAMSIDDSLKLEPGRSKPLLVDALGDLLPREVWDRPKQGFVLPFERWMRGPLQGDVAAALSSGDRLARVGLSAAAASVVWQGFQARRPGLSWSRAWALYVLVRWAEENGAEIEADQAASRVMYERRQAVGV